jgi:D-xylose 1-dehydrogenase (NADP+, D-xylono-1,5-lactone-forming)
VRDTEGNMPENKLRWGVISTANIGRRAVIPAIQACSNGEMIAAASRNKDLAVSFAAELEIPRWYGSYEDLLDDEDIDAVYIPLPNSLHKEWVIRAARAGKHVLCEKPLGLSFGECQDMQAAARENNVKLMEAFMYRFHPRTEKILKLVRDGALGELRFINASFTFRLRSPNNIRLSKELGGGSLMDVGCYCVNVIRTLTAAEPVEVQAYVNWADSGVDLQMAGALKFEGGLLANFDSGLNLERRETVTVAGTEGYLEIPKSFLPGKVDAHFSLLRGEAERIDYRIAGVDQYKLMVEHFGDCVLNAHPLRYPAQEAAANMRIIEALYQSAIEDGKPIRLNG